MNREFPLTSLSSRCPLPENDTIAVDARYPRSTFAIGAIILGDSQGSGLYHDFDFDMQIQENVCGEGSNTHFGLGPARPFVP